MLETKYSRRLDSNGRLVIPIRLREEMGLEVGQEYTFFKHEHEGKMYLCIECVELENEIERAKKILEAAGVKVGN